MDDLLDIFEKVFKLLLGINALIKIDSIKIGMEQFDFLGYTFTVENGVIRKEIPQHRRDAFSRLGVPERYH